jgi:hypothetical protein
MRGPRHEMMQLIDTLLDFGKIVASSMSDKMKNVLVSVTGAETQYGAERADNQPLYAHAGVLFRPAAPSEAGVCELVYARVGDEMVPLATRDCRWQRDLEEGEVYMRSMSDTSARIHAMPDGSSYTHATEIKLGSKDASEAVAIASKVEERLDKIAAALDTLCSTAPTTGDGGLALRDAVKAIWGTGPTPPSDVAASKVKVE